MTRPRGRMMVLLVLLIAIIVAAPFTYHCETHWHLYSGEERLVSSLFGLPGIPHPRKSTELSQWRAFDGCGEEWITVATTPKISGLLVNLCHVKITNYLINIRPLISDPNNRAICAELILNDLKSGRDICKTSKRTGRFRDALTNLNFDSIAVDQPASEGQLRVLWERSENAQRNAAGQPATRSESK